MKYGTVKKMIKLSAAPAVRNVPASDRMSALMAEMPTDDAAAQQQNNLKTLAGLSAAGFGGGLAAGNAKGMTGRTSIYHGGKAGIEDLVKKQGLRSRADLGDSLSNASVTETVTSPEVNSASKNLVFTTSDKGTARTYANQVKAMDDAVAEGKDAASGLSQFRSNLLNLITAPYSAPEGSVAEMNVPLWKLREQGDLVRNPEIDDLIKRDVEARRAAEILGLRGEKIDKYVRDTYEELLGESGGTYTIRGGVGTEYVPGASNYKRVSLGEISEFARKNPRQFGGATAKTVGGLGAGAMGLKVLADAIRNRSGHPSVGTMNEGAEYGIGSFGEGIQKVSEIEYRGKKFPGYNQPIDSDRPEKKKMVLAKKGDQVKLIHFGQKGYKHNYSDTAKKNYLTRSAGIRGKDGSLTANDKFSANYWARRELWPKNEPADGSARNREKRASMLKTAYGPKQHQGLAGVTARGAEASGPARQMMVEGALATDKGIRHPWLPHTDNLHSFAGSQTRGQIGSGIAARQQDAVSDISNSIAGAKGKLGVGGYLKSGVRGVRGLLNTGDTQHSLVDISSHYNKPLTQGSDTAIRGVLPKSGYGGILVGGREHVNAEKLVRNAAEGKDISSAIAEIDQLRPSASPDDAQAVNRSRRFGSATRKKVEAQLVQQHGMSPEQAARSADEFFNRATFSDASKRVGEVSRDVRYVKREAGRAADALKGALSGVLRRGRA